MKKFTVCLWCMVNIVCLAVLSACGIFDDEWFNSNEEAENQKENYSRYFSTLCPISLNENSYIWSLSSDSVAMQLNFQNISEKKIIAYEAVCILYNIYGEMLIYGGHISPYNQISETPENFENGITDRIEYSFSSKVYYAEVYIYFALFDDQTSWGVRTDMETETILELGTKYKIERKNA